MDTKLKKSIVVVNSDFFFYYDAIFSNKLIFQFRLFIEN